MKLHESVVKKLMRIYDLHGGRKDETKLKFELEKLDLTAYTQKTNDNNKTFLVLTEDTVVKPK